MIIALEPAYTVGIIQPVAGRCEMELVAVSLCIKICQILFCIKLQRLTEFRKHYTVAQDIVISAEIGQLHGTILYADLILCVFFQL